MREHEWITVGDRQWCLTCEAFQHRRDSRRPWVPSYRPTCPWNTEYAIRKLAGAQVDERWAGAARAE